MFRSTLTFLWVALASFGIARDDDTRYGHSKHGKAFDSGMRTRPWVMEGVGMAPFPISTKSAEVQKWYDQGNELLHSFWFEEAERSFRWCHKMEPENAMVYFGLARCGMNWFSVGSPDVPEMQKYRDFLKEAVKRKDTVTERERLYIEAWDAAMAKTGEDARHELVHRLEALCIKYPDDIEAKCQLAFYNIGGGSALANEFLLQKVLAVNPMHPGAHHARIHNWDGVSPDQAIESCEQYGKAAPGIGHSLHMPGHIYTKVGMWHEAAIAMDSATRVELAYMNDRLALPFETWNYPHNRDYLCYIQEQLGRAEASIQGAKDMMQSPRDGGDKNNVYPAFVPLIRALLKFERWDDILSEKTFPATKDEYFNSVKTGADIVALVAKGRKKEAREKVDAFRAEAARLAKAAPKDPKQEGEAPSFDSVGEALLLVAEGKRLDGVRMLLVLADRERKAREEHQYPNDPPIEAWPVMRILGDVYFEGGEYGSAIEAYERALEQEVNDAWCLAGLAKSWAAKGDKAKAKTYAGRFLAVWDGADKGLRLTKEIEGLKLGAKPVAETLKPEHAYDPKALDALGPSNWRPFSAPELSCLSVDGKTVTLKDYAGKNVLLVFYLSDQCAHCMEQLDAINKRLGEFKSADTVVLAVSAAKPEVNKVSAALSTFGVTLLSDPDHSNARRFSSYDDFEDLELHSTILIDKNGKVRWKRTGGDPFSDVNFLLDEIKRCNAG